MSVNCGAVGAIEIDEAKRRWRKQIGIAIAIDPSEATTLNRRNGMALGRENLDVYRLAIAYVAWVYEKDGTRPHGGHAEPTGCKRIPGAGREHHLQTVQGKRSSWASMRRGMGMISSGA